MKKRIIVIMWIAVLSVLLCMTVGATASDPAKEPVPSKENADISVTGSSYEDLGASFYARIGMDDPKKYFTIPDDVMQTTQMKEYMDSSVQFWHFTRQSDGSYKIRNVNKNLYLELYNGKNPGEYSETFHTDEDNLGDQRWFLKKAGDGYQFISCSNPYVMLNAINLYGSHTEVVMTKDPNKVTTHFTITKLPINSDLLATPAVKLACVNGGVSITWDKVYYATSYRVYRYNASTKKWVSITKTTGASYTDKSVKSGTTYQYYVRSVTPMLSGYQTKSIKYLAAPSPSVTNTASGPYISWPKVTGAQAYTVFYKTTGSWKPLGTTTATHYTHSKPSYNVNYSYTVRCSSTNGKQFTSAYNTTGIHNRIVQTPKLTVTLKPNGFQLNWNNITGAYRYMVMIKSKATNWIWGKATPCIYNNYFYSGAANNQAYYFTVRCMDQNNKYISGYTSSAKFTYYSAPKIKQLKVTSSKVTLAWNKVSGAAKYIVYSWNGKTWIKRTVTKALSTSFKVIGSAKQNQCFMVRCLNSKGKNISSYYETIVSGGKLKYYSPGGYSSKNKF